MEVGRERERERERERGEREREGGIHRIIIDVLRQMFRPV